MKIKMTAAQSASSLVMKAKESVAVSGRLFHLVFKKSDVEGGNGLKDYANSADNIHCCHLRRKTKRFSRPSTVNRII